MILATLAIALATAAHLSRPAADGRAPPELMPFTRREAVPSAPPPDGRRE